MLLQTILPAVVTYNAVISACEKGQHPHQALQLLQEMQLKDILPNAVTYKAAISACEKGQHPHQALHLSQAGRSVASSPT